LESVLCEVSRLAAEVAALKVTTSEQGESLLALTQELRETKEQFREIQPIEPKDLFGDDESSGDGPDLVTVRVQRGSLIMDTHTAGEVLNGYCESRKSSGAPSLSPSRLLSRSPLGKWK
jgi:hypothetical protein